MWRIAVAELSVSLTVQIYRQIVRDTARRPHADAAPLVEQPTRRGHRQKPLAVGPSPHVQLCIGESRCSFKCFPGRGFGEPAVFEAQTLQCSEAAEGLRERARAFGIDVVAAKTELRQRGEAAERLRERACTVGGDAVVGEVEVFQRSEAPQRHRRGCPDPLEAAETPQSHHRATLDLLEASEAPRWHRRGTAVAAKGAAGAPHCSASGRAWEG